MKRMMLGALIALTMVSMFTGCGKKEEAPAAEAVQNVEQQAAKEGQAVQQEGEKAAKEGEKQAK